MPRLWRIGLGIRKLMVRLGPRGSAIRAAEAKFGPRVRQIQRIEREWPEVRELCRQANEAIRRDRKRAVEEKLTDGIEAGRIAGWLPREKIAAAQTFIQLALGGINIGQRELKILDLEKEAGALKKLVEIEEEKF